MRRYRTMNGGVLCVVMGGALLAGRAAAQTPAAAPTSSAPASSGALPAPPDVASANETDPTVEQAREAFVLGTALAQQGQWPEALSAFERSSGLRPHPVTTYNIAYSERALGHYTRAYKMFRRCLSEHAAATGGTLPGDLLALAKGYLPEVEHRLAHAQVRTEPAGVALSVDGSPLEVGSPPGDAHLVLLAGTRDDRGREAPPSSAFELLLDPGRHLFVLSVPGSEDRVVSETFEAGASRELVLNAGAPPPSEKPPESGITLESPKPTESHARRTWAYVSYGVGGAGLITGSIFGILTLNKKSALNPHCPTPSTCDPKQQGDVDTMHRDAAFATVGLVVGLVGAGLGTYLLLSGGSTEKLPPKTANSAFIEPWVSSSMLGARGRF
jgi:hypothetical protein